MNGIYYVRRLQSDDIYESQLSHHGIKGQKWGVRRYQNADGTRTPAGKRHYASGDADGNSKVRGTVVKKSNTGKKVRNILITAGILTATATAATVYVRNNPRIINGIKSKLSGVKLKDISDGVIQKGKEYLQSAKAGIKEGIGEGMKEGPKKAAKTVLAGASMLGAKKLLDKLIGEQNSEKIFKANDKKKVGNFWKSTKNDKDDDD